jgi:hypothetical protein
LVLVLVLEKDWVVALPRARVLLSAAAPPETPLSLEAWPSAKAWTALLEACSTR